MYLTWLDGFSPRVSRQLALADRTDVAASLLTVALLMVFNGLIQSLVGIILAVADGTLPTGLGPLNGGPLRSAALFFEGLFMAILAFGGGMLASDLALRVTRGLLVDIHPTPHCLLATLLLLLLGIVALGLSEAPGGAFQLSWTFAVALPGWIAGLPIGAGSAVRTEYGRPITAGLGLVTIPVALALLLVASPDPRPRGADPARQVEPGEDSALRATQPLPIKAPERPTSQSNAQAERCHAEAAGQGSFGEGNARTESEARAQAMLACHNESCWITIAGCRN